MTNRDSYDAIIVGSGPNGLAAAITMARAGSSVLVIEGKDTIGGGMRSAQLTLPGFTHDVCSAVHPLANGSPFFNAVPLAEYGLEWVHPTIPLAHPLDARQRLRSDEVTEVVDRELLQQGAPAIEDGLYLVPRVVQ